MAISRVSMVPYLDIKDCVSDIRTFPFYFMINTTEVNHAELVVVDIHEEKMCDKQALNDANHVNRCLRSQHNSEVYTPNTVSLSKKYQKCPDMERCYHTVNGTTKLRTGSEPCVRVIGAANVERQFPSRCLNRSASCTDKQDKVSNSMPLFGTMDHSPTENAQLPSASYGNAASLGHLEDSGYGSSGACECRQLDGQINLTNIACRQCFRDNGIQTRCKTVVNTSCVAKQSHSSGATCKLKMENENNPHTSFEYDDISISESLDMPVQEKNAAALPRSMGADCGHISLPMDHNGDTCRSETFPCLRKIETKRITRSRKFSQYLSPLYPFIPIIGTVFALFAYRRFHRNVSRHPAQREQRAYRSGYITAATVIVNILLTLGLLVIIIVIMLRNVQAPPTTVRTYSLNTVTPSSLGPHDVTKSGCVVSASQSKGTDVHSVLNNVNTDVKILFQNATVAAYFNPCKNKTEIVTFGPSLIL